MKTTTVVASQFDINFEKYIAKVVASDFKCRAFRWRAGSATRFMVNIQ